MARRIVSLVSLFLVCVAGPLLAAAPDLTVARLAVNPAAPIPGSTVTISATIENVGSSDATSQFFVQYDIDGKGVAAVAVPLGLRVGERTEVSAEWIAEEGPHLVSVEADQPFDRIPEANESNNTSSVTLVVPFRAVVGEQYDWLRVAVARFEDHSGSGFVNVGEGVADKLSDRLTRSGIHVIGRSELETVMQQGSLDPGSTDELTTAAQILGADLLITGTVTEVRMQEASVEAWIFRLSSASVDVSIVAQIVAVHTGTTLSTLSGEAHEEGLAEFSVDLASILSLPASFDVCAGGLTTDRTWYYPGETVPIGFLNPSAPSWYSVEIHSSAGAFLRWLGLQYVPTAACGMWFWDQRDSVGTRLSPGVYFAKLRAGTTYVETISFQIRPGAGLFPLVDEITVGDTTFDETIVGGTVNKAVDQLAASFVHGLDGLVPLVAETEARAGTASSESHREALEGKIAAILPDGRIAINIGTLSGVGKGDFFQVLAVENLVVDPQSLQILEYDVIAVRGEIVVVEARDRVSYAVKAEEFEPTVGDVVRFVRP